MLHGLMVETVTYSHREGPGQVLQETPSDLDLAFEAAANLPLQAGSKPGHARVLYKQRQEDFFGVIHWQEVAFFEWDPDTQIVRRYVAEEALYQCEWRRQAGYNHAGNVTEAGEYGEPRVVKAPSVDDIADVPERVKAADSAPDEVTTQSPQEEDNI
mgnify:CR=1 FL=1